MKIFFYLLFQLILFVLLSPLIAGFINKIKNNLRMRKGPSIFQPYYNLIKLFSKDEVISVNTSWIYRVTPFVLLSSSLTAAMLIPVFPSLIKISYAGDLLAVFFIFLLGRFFLTLAGLDCASTFAGMGSSREMFISSLAEPCAILAVFAVALKTGTTNLYLLGQSNTLEISMIAAFSSLFMVMLAETSRLPIDNQETHLELTMIHEAMVLEYGGKSLAIIELSSYIKQMIWLFILALLITHSILATFAVIVLISVVIATLEAVMAKMRLLRLVDYFSFSAAIAVIAVVCAILGV